MVIILAAPQITGLAQTSQGIDVRSINTYLSENLKKNRIQGFAVGVVQGDQVLFTKGYGLAGHGRETTPQTQFYIGSVSKTFTALAVMQLVEKGLIDLDAPVQKYIPWFEIADKDESGKITIRNLLNHTSGLSEAGDRNASAFTSSLDEQAGLLKDAHLTAPVGVKFQYYNQNYRLLGLIIEKVSGMSYGDYIQTHIFDPLGMDRSTADPLNAPDLAQAYTRFFGFAVPMQQSYIPGWLPSGYLISTAEDMSKFLLAQINNQKPDGSQLLEPELLAIMRSEPAGVDGGYGMGWLILDDGDTIAHGGANEFFQSFILIHQKDKTGMVLLFNQNSMESMQFENNNVRNGLLELLDGRPPKQNGAGWIGWVLLALFGLDLFNHARLFAALGSWKKKIDTKNRLRIRVGAVTVIVLTIFVIFGVPVLVAVIKGGAPSWMEPLRFQPDLIIWLLLGMSLDLVRNCIKLVLVARSQ